MQSSLDSSLRSLAEIDPRLVEFDKEGPSSVHYERIGAVLTNLVKRQRDRIAELEAQNAPSSQDLMQRYLKPH